MQINITGHSADIPGATLIGIIYIQKLLRTQLNIGGKNPSLLHDVVTAHRTCHMSLYYELISI